MDMEAMAAEFGIKIGEVPGLHAPRYVSDCDVLILPAGLDATERIEAIAECLEFVTESRSTSPRSRL